MTKIPKSQLCDLIFSLEKNEIGISDFCLEYENIYNFSKCKQFTDNIEFNLFSELFDDVVLYSGYKEELEKYSLYKSEIDIRNKVFHLRERGLCG